MLSGVPIDHHLTWLRREMVAHSSAGIVLPVVRVQVMSTALQTPPPRLVRRPEDLAPLGLQSLGIGFPRISNGSLIRLDHPDLRHTEFVEGVAPAIMGSHVLKQLLGPRHGLPPHGFPPSLEPSGSGSRGK
jgi:hypothetical protein